MVYTGANIKTILQDTSGNEITVGPINEVDFTIDQQLEQVASLGNGRTYKFNVDKSLLVNGTVKAYLTDPSIFEYALGTKTTDSDTGTTTYSVSDTIPAFNILVDNGDDQVEISNSYIDKLTIASAKDDYFNAEIDFKAQDLTTGSYTVSPSEPDTPLMFYSGSIKYNGTVVADIEDFNIDFTNNLEPIITIGNRKPDYLPKMLDIDIKLTALFKDLSYLTDVINEKNDTTIELNFGSVNITLSGVELSAYTLNMPAESDLLRQDLTGKALNVTVTNK